MATRRDVDVVIGARTDDASFQKAEAKTKGFLGKLRGGPAGAAGAAGGDPFLQRTAQASETLAKLTQAVVLAEAVGGAVSAAFDGVSIISARIAGDIQRADEATAKFQQTLEQVPVIGTIAQAGGAIGEAFFQDKADAEAIAKLTERNAQINDRNREQASKAFQEALRVEADLVKRQRLRGLEGIELEKERAKIAYESEVERLRIMQQQTQNLKAQQRLENVIWGLESDLNAQFKEIENRKAAKGEKTGAAATPTTATLTSGLRLSGLAQSSRAGMTFQAEQQRVAEGTEENTKATADLLRDLVDIMRRTTTGPAFIQG